MELQERLTTNKLIKDYITLYNIVKKCNHKELDDVKHEIEKNLEELILDNNNYDLITGELIKT